ncbi:leaf rust 10 disease-resistance locus receptor-like protein kinase-like 1.4 protein [Tanacetum coccineum]|uniref:non-specific serine/threonine protein kinase n=1 Tax=Tanacetum coccineum TaxID=301880 RepID=A0ABQ4ZKH5_9ASTR
MKPGFDPSLVLFVIIVSLATTITGQNNRAYDDCGQKVECGDINLEYPFWGADRPRYCGHPGFQLTCQSDVPVLLYEPVNYRVLENPDTSARTIKVARADLWSNLCPPSLHNTTYNSTLFNGDNFNQENVSLFYKCNTSLFVTQPFGNIFPCTVNTTSSDSYFLIRASSTVVSTVSDLMVQCENHIEVPVNQTSANILGSATATSENLQSALKAGFNLRWTVFNNECDDCMRSNGRCGSNSTSPELFVCYCANGNFSTTCDNRSVDEGGSGSSSLPIILAIVGAVVAIVVIGGGILCCRQRRKRRAIKEASPAQTETKAILTSSTVSSNYNFTSSIPSYPNSSKTSKDYTKSSYFGTQVFTYEELAVATDNFNDSRELGDGGFGTVYYGKLLDGREVAVKRLYENNFKRVEQFLNEVEILTRLEHENLVKLYGCTSKRSKELILVYEYIPNGTVADHLHGKLANSSSSIFSWSVRLNISIETAEALAYLHKSDIIHRDVKTNNILLDKSFRVKVADFGLSRLFPNDATHVSTAPQGTPGYVDPEYYQCYQLTDKSDVYSFGVVLIELISSLQAVDTNRHKLDINLANLAMTKIQNHMLEELVDKSIGFETNGTVRRMITLVSELAFRCLQQEKDMRPTMKEVVEILRGIQNDEQNAQKPEVLDIVVDDGALLKDHNTEPPSPDFGATNKLVDSSVPSSSDS